MTLSLQEYVAIDPAYDRAHIRLAAVALRRFQHEQITAVNPMDLSQIRDAALASRFTSRQALNQWLDRAVGSHRKLLDAALRHARQGLRLCPLEGEGYVLLANLCFLEGAAEGAKSALVAQAVRVRPHDGYVAMAAGKESAISGDLAAAAGHWQRAYHGGSQHQYELVALLSGQTPVSFLLTTFEPTVEQWAPFFAVYLHLQAHDQLQQVCDFFLAKAQQQPAEASSELWHALARGYQSTGRQPIAESCARQAVTMSPEDIGSRTLLATILLDGEKHSEAEQQLRWCLQRTSADGRLKELLEVAVRGRVAVAGRSPDRVTPAVARAGDQDMDSKAGLK
jgi:Flp pilus assembly protein TadD